MTDTLPEIERLLREKMMARTAEERFIMGAQMFDAAVTMVDASLPPNLPEAERKWRGRSVARAMAVLMVS